MSKMMVVICLLLSVLGVQTASAGWSSVDFDGFANLSAVSFPQGDAAWTCDTDGTVWTSTDAGQTWSNVTTIDFSSLTGIAFTDDMVGTASSEWGAIYATSDGGMTWTTVFEAWVSFFDVYAMPGTQNVWVGGQNTVMQSFVVWTYDGWVTQDAWFFYYDIDNVFTEGYVRGITALSTDHLVAVGNTWLWDGAIAVSTDGGTNWTTNWFGTGDVVWDVAVNDAETLIAGTDSGSILRSDDGGTTWISVHSVPGTPLKGVASVGNGVFRAVGNGGTILVSTDDGATWSAEDSGTTMNLRSVDFVSQTEGIAVGEGGAVVVYSGAAPDPVTLTLTPANTTIPETGGTLTYDVHLQSNVDNTYTNVSYWTDVVLPNGNTYGPTFTQTFTMPPFMDHTATGLTQNVPAAAPAGTYTFQGHVGYMNGPSIMDSFEFTKAGALAGGFSENDWTVGGSLMTDNELTELRTLPTDFAISAITPNPFNPTTRISVTLPEDAELTLSVFNVAGQQVATLADGQRSAGQHTYSFDGSTFSSGVYFVRAQVPGQHVALEKMTLIK